MTQWKSKLDKLYFPSCLQFADVLEGSWDNFNILSKNILPLVCGAQGQKKYPYIQGRRYYSHFYDQSLFELRVHMSPFHSNSRE